MSRRKTGLMLRRRCKRWGDLNILQMVLKGRHLRMCEAPAIARSERQVFTEET